MRVRIQIDLSNNRLCGAWFERDSSDLKGIYTMDGIEAIAHTIGMRSLPSLTSIGKQGLNLKGNLLEDAGWSIIFAAVCSRIGCKITSIDASRERIGVVGAKAIGKSLQDSVCPSLSQVPVFRS